MLWVFFIFLFALEVGFLFVCLFLYFFGGSINILTKGPSAVLKDMS